ncbi:MAG: tetratricopeptide repeat protein, partial [Lachnospiraceae bacterium]|nr:tetratricopeptide repeat protein [Lachnospiraceae bacterium]
MRFSSLICTILFLFCLTGCSGAGTENLELGMADIQNEKYEDALQKFEKAEKLGEDPELVCRGKGIARMGLADYEGAATDLTQALSECRGSVTDLEYDISFYLAVAQFRSGNLAGAIDTYDAILDLDRNNPDAYYLRGKTKLSMGNKDEALRDFNAAIRFDSSNPDLYINVYECMADAGYAEEGETFLKSAMQLTHINGFQKGKLYYWMGDYDSAKSALEEARGDGSDESVILYLGKT